MKPTAAPQWPNDRPLTPRTTSVNRIRELEIVDVELPIPDDHLAEIVPFGSLADEDGVEWVAVRVSIDWPGVKATVAAGGWIERTSFDQLPHLRALILLAPDSPSALSTAEQWERMFRPSRRRTPSMKQRLEVRPSDGSQLLREWKQGRRPVLRTLAFIERALVETEQAESEVVAQAWHHLTERELRQPERNIITEALELLVRTVGHLDHWPTADHPSADELFEERWMEADDPDDPYFGGDFDQFD